MIANKDTAGTSGQSPTSSALLSAIQRMGSEVSASLRMVAEKMEVLAKQQEQPRAESLGGTSKPKDAESSTGRPDAESSRGKNKARQHEDTEMSESDGEAESSSRHWADRNTTLKDLPTPIFQDSDDESFEVSESTSELLAAAFTMTLPNAER